MTKLNVAIWVIIAALHLAVIARAILLAGRDPYARAAWLLLLIALPFVGLTLYVLFAEPWTPKRFRQRGRRVYEELLLCTRGEAHRAGRECDEMAWGQGAAHMGRSDFQASMVGVARIELATPTMST